MKTYSIISFVLLALFLGTLMAQAQDNIPALENIEKRLDKAFAAEFTKSKASLSKILSKLEEADKKQPHRSLTYWRAYAHYYASVVALKKKAQENGIKHHAKAVKLLSSLKNKSSDECVLLAMNISLGISFNQSTAIAASSKAAKYYEKALKKDKKNIRAYYGRANSDFYTPKQYGGGTLVESMALKGLSLQDTYSSSPYAPTWGRQEIYGLLVRYYIREDAKQKAILYCKQGLKKYPKSYELQSALNKLTK